MRFIKWENKGKGSPLTPGIHWNLVSSLPQRIPGLRLTSASGDEFGVTKVAYFRVPRRHFAEALSVLNVLGQAEEDICDRIFEAVAPYLP